MKLTKKTLEDVRFRSRGRWYDGEQVDSFLEELTVAVDEAERDLEKAGREVSSQREELEALRAENLRLRQELDSLRAQAAPDSREARRQVCRELSRERDSLIQDIKALRRFREAFRESVERDAAALSRQAKELGSDQLL